MNRQSPGTSGFASGARSVWRPGQTGDSMALQDFQARPCGGGVWKSCLGAALCLAVAAGWPAALWAQERQNRGAELEALGRAAMLQVFPNPQQESRALRLEDRAELLAGEGGPATPETASGIGAQPSTVQPPTAQPPIPAVARVVPPPPRKPGLRAAGGAVPAPPAPPASEAPVVVQRFPGGWQVWAGAAGAGESGAAVWERFQRMKNSTGNRKFYDINPETWSSLTTPGKGRLRLAGLLGAWSCRTLKLVPDAVFGFPYGDCRFSLKDGHVFLERTDAGQRWAGYLWEEGRGGVFLGAVAAGSAAPPLYSGLALAPRSGATSDPVPSAPASDPASAPASDPASEPASDPAQDRMGWLFPAAGGQVLVLFPEPGAYAMLELIRETPSSP